MQDGRTGTEKRETFHTRSFPVSKSIRHALIWRREAPPGMDSLRAFILVTVNPPYMIGGHGLTGENEALTAARHEILCSLEDVCGAAAYALRPQGRLCMVHRPFRLADIFRNLNAYGLEPKRMRLVHPMEGREPNMVLVEAVRGGREPNMVLVEAVRGGRPRLTVEKPLVIYERPGVYTEEVRALYG